jgi:hypothetical protein
VVITEGALSPVTYVWYTDTFRVPFDASSLGNIPFSSVECNASSRLTVQVDDSSLNVEHSIVYFDNATQEFVFLGDQAPPTGTYQILVTAVLKTDKKYVTKSFTFNLVVGSVSI